MADLNENGSSWYDSDALFYVIVAMITFTSIVGTFLYYKDQLLADQGRRQNEEDDEEDDEEENEEEKEEEESEIELRSTNITPRCHDPLCEESDSSTESEEDVSTETIITSEQVAENFAENITLDSVFDDRNHSPSESLLLEDANFKDIYLSEPTIKELISPTNNGQPTFKIDDYSSTPCMTPNTIRRRNLEILVETDESVIDDDDFKSDESSAENLNENDDLIIHSYLIHGKMNNDIELVPAEELKDYHSQHTKQPEIIPQMKDGSSITPKLESIDNTSAKAVIEETVNCLEESSVFKENSANDFLSDYLIQNSLDVDSEKETTTDSDKRIEIQQDFDDDKLDYDNSKAQVLVRNLDSQETDFMSTNTENSEEETSQLSTAISHVDDEILGSPNKNHAEIKQLIDTKGVGNPQQELINEQENILARQNSQDDEKVEASCSKTILTSEDQNTRFDVDVNTPEHVSVSSQNNGVVSSFTDNGQKIVLLERFHQQLGNTIANEESNPIIGDKTTCRQEDEQQLEHIEVKLHESQADISFSESTSEEHTRPYQEEELSIQDELVAGSETRDEMGKILSTIFDIEFFEDIPLERLEQLGGKIIVSEDGEYAIIDFEGQRKEYKVDKVKLRKENKAVFDNKLRDSKDLSQLFEHLESLDVVGKSNEDDVSHNNNQIEISSTTKQEQVISGYAKEENELLNNDGTTTASRLSSDHNESDVLRDNNEVILHSTLSNDDILNKDHSFLNFSTNSYNAVEENFVSTYDKDEANIHKLIDTTQLNVEVKIQTTRKEQDINDTISLCTQTKENGEKTLEVVGEIREKSELTLLPTSNHLEEKENIQQEDITRDVLFNEINNLYDGKPGFEEEESLRVEFLSHVESVPDVQIEYLEQQEQFIHDTITPQSRHNDCIANSNNSLERIKLDVHNQPNEKNANNSHELNAEVIIRSDGHFKNINTTDGVNVYEIVKKGNVVLTCCDSDFNTDEQDQVHNQIIHSKGVEDNLVSTDSIHSSPSTTLHYQETTDFLSPSRANQEDEYYFICQQRSKSLNNIHDLVHLHTEGTLKEGLQASKSMEYIDHIKPRIKLSSRHPHVSKIKETNLDDLIQSLQKSSSAEKYNCTLHLSDENNNNSFKLAEEEAGSLNDNDKSLPFESSYSETEIDLSSDDECGNQASDLSGVQFPSDFFYNDRIYQSSNLKRFSLPDNFVNYVSPGSSERLPLIDYKLILEDNQLKRGYSESYLDKIGQKSSTDIEVGFTPLNKTSFYQHNPKSNQNLSDSFLNSFNDDSLSCGSSFLTDSVDIEHDDLPRTYDLHIEDEDEIENVEIYEVEVSPEYMLQPHEFDIKPQLSTVSEEREQTIPEILVIEELKQPNDFEIVPQLSTVNEEEEKKQSPALPDIPPEEVSKQSNESDIATQLPTDSEHREQKTPDILSEGDSKPNEYIIISQLPLVNEERKQTDSLPNICIEKDLYEIDKETVVPDSVKELVNEIIEKAKEILLTDVKCKQAANETDEDNHEDSETKPVTSHDNNILGIDSDMLKHIQSSAISQGPEETSSDVEEDLNDAEVSGDNLLGIDSDMLKHLQSSAISQGPEETSTDVEEDLNDAEVSGGNILGIDSDMLKHLQSKEVETSEEERFLSVNDGSLSSVENETSGDIDTKQSLIVDTTAKEFVSKIIAHATELFIAEQQKGLNEKKPDSLSDNGMLDSQIFPFLDDDLRSIDVQEDSTKNDVTAPPAVEETDDLPSDIMQQTEKDLQNNEVCLDSNLSDNLGPIMDGSTLNDVSVPFKETNLLSDEIKQDEKSEPIENNEPDETTKIETVLSLSDELQQEKDNEESLSHSPPCSDNQTSLSHENDKDEVTYPSTEEKQIIPSSDVMQESGNEGLVVNMQNKSAPDEQLSSETNKVDQAAQIEEQNSLPENEDAISKTNEIDNVGDRGEEGNLEMKRDSTLFSVISDVCNAYSPATKSAEVKECQEGNLERATDAFVDFEIASPNNDIACLQTSEKFSMDELAINEPLTIQDETIDGDIKDAMLLPNTSRMSDTDTLDITISTISSSDIPSVGTSYDLTHVSHLHNPLQEHLINLSDTLGDSTEGSLHITTESTSDGGSTSDFTVVTNIDSARSDKTFHDSLDDVAFKPNNVFSSSTPRDVTQQHPTSTQRTIFEEIVETRTEIVVESEYQIENELHTETVSITRAEPCKDQEAPTTTLKQKETEVEKPSFFIPIIVEELVKPLNDEEVESMSPLDTTLEADVTHQSLVDGDVLDTTADLKEAVISEQKEPVSVAKHLLDESSPVQKRKGNVERSDSWKFSSDYKLSRNSQHLIESIEMDMEDEMLNDMDPEEDEVDRSVQEMLDVRANLRRVRKDSKTTDDIPRRLVYDNNLSSASPALQRKLKSRDKGRQWKSRSLHNIFHGGELETDIDTVDDKELMDVLKSPKLKEKSPDVFVTDVDKVFKTTPMKPTDDDKKPRKFVVVSRTSNIRRFSQDAEEDLQPGLPRRCQSWDQRSKGLPKGRHGISKFKKSASTEEIKSEKSWKIDADEPMETDIDNEDDGIDNETTSKEPTAPVNIMDAKQEVSISNHETDIKNDGNEMVVDNSSPLETPTPLPKHDKEPKFSFETEQVVHALRTKIDEEQIVPEQKKDVEKMAENLYDNIIEAKEKLHTLSSKHNGHIIADEPVATEIVKSALNIYHLDEKEERFTEKEIIVNVSADKFKATVIGRNRDGNKLRVNNTKNNRDSWDVLSFEEPPKLTERKSSKKVIEKGVFHRDVSVDKSQHVEKHQSWNILDLNKNKPIDPLTDFFENGGNMPQPHQSNPGDISYLFEQYQREREALKKLQDRSKRNSVGSLSDFSEISSLSEEDEDSQTDSWYQELSDAEEPELSHNKMETGRLFSLQQSPRISPRTTASPPSNVEAVRRNVIRSSTPTETQRSKPVVHSEPPLTAFSPILRHTHVSADPFVSPQPSSPSKQPLSPKLSPKHGGTVEETVIKPFPAPVKPDFVPEVSTFSEEDLGSMVMAQAVSAVRKRRGRRGRRNINAEQPPAPKVEDLNIKETVPVIPSHKDIPLSFIEMIKNEPQAPVDIPQSPPKPPRGIFKKSTEPLEFTREIPTNVAPLSQENLQILESKSPEVKRRNSSSNSTDSTVKSKDTAAEARLHVIPKSPKQMAKISAARSPTLSHKQNKDNNVILREAATMLDNNNTRSYDYVNSMPDIFTSSRFGMEVVESEDYQSEVSMVSDIGFDSCFEGSIIDDQVFLYPSVHMNIGDVKSKPLVKDFSDSSGDESFTTEQSERFKKQTSTSDTQRTVYCGYPPCSHKQVMLGNEKSRFISCNSCFTCYCSKTCKRMHWAEHKKNCFFGRINLYVKTIVRKCERDVTFNSQLRNSALKSYRSKGRGCLVLAFNSPSEAKEITTSRTTELSSTPEYTTVKNIVQKNKQSKHSRVLCQSLLDYDPEQEFVINISIRIGKTRTAKAKKRTSNVVRCARISSLDLTNANQYDKSLSSYYIRTFCLPRVAAVDYMNDVEVRRYYCKELSFSVKRCGVRLKLDYPEAYEKLSRYVEDEKPFLPIVLYGQKGGKNYKCILHQGKYNPSEEARGEGVLV